MAAAVQGTPWQMTMAFRICKEFRWVTNLRVSPAGELSENARACCIMKKSQVRYLFIEKVWMNPVSLLYNLLIVYVALGMRVLFSTRVYAAQ